MQQLLGPGTSEIRTERRLSHWYFLSPEHAVEVFKSYFGPTQPAFQVLDPPGQETLQKELLEMFSSATKAKDGTLYVTSEYLQVLATRK